MDETYRGFTIRLRRNALWQAVLLDAETGAMLPTMATSLLAEGRGVALKRAVDLVDVYCRGLDAGHEHAG